MEKSPHVMLAGDAADQFGVEQGVQMVTQDYYFTEKRWQSLLAAKKKGAGATGHGTVGAVALDRKGNLAAATSTGVDQQSRRPGGRFPDHRRRNLCQ